MSNIYTQKTMLLKILRMSRFMKIKKGWSREIGAGFIKEDIKRIGLDHTDKGKSIITIAYAGDSYIAVEPKELNLRETEEAIKFLENDLIFNHKMECYQLMEVGKNAI